MIEFASALVLLWFGYKLGRSGIELSHKREVERLEGLLSNAIDWQNGFIREAEFLLGETGDTAETDMWMYQSPVETLEDAMFAAGKAAGVTLFLESITSVLKHLGSAIDRPSLRDSDIQDGSPQTKALKEEIRKRRKEKERREETRKRKEEERAHLIKSLLGESVVPGHPLSEFRRRFLRLLEAKSRR